MHDNDKVRMETSPFKNCKSFSDLFEDVYTREVLSPDGGTPEPEGWRWTLNESLGEKSALITSHFSLRGGGHFFVKPRKEVLTFLRESMLNIDWDHYYFKGVERADGTTLILCQYNSIIGSRWLSLVDSETVPKDPYR